MKKIYLFIVMAVFVIACNSDSQEGINNAGSDGQGGSTAIFALKGDYLYSVDHNNLNVFSLLSTTGPVQVNTVQVGFDIETLFADGDKLYIGSQNGMFIYSITNPEDPEMLASVSHFTACDPVVANGTHAYVTLHTNTWCGNNTNALMVYDIANINEPVLVHSRTLIAPKGLGLYANYLVVCDDIIKIFDITSPEEPVLATTINRPCNDVIIRGNELFAVGDFGIYNYTLNAENISAFTQNREVSFAE
ncbi:hypothetical protein ACLI09_11290 [Flavobacterium sp. RHBU_24]|uniref:hypothetical protein n=1 Tax=Flavobacterium sp. RHBU_24 TaxID=3391185 RepID=UPI003984B0AD